jgi:hypothetical protein
MESLNGRRLVVGALRRTCPGCPTVWEGPIEKDPQLSYLYMRSAWTKRQPRTTRLTIPCFKNALLDAFFIWPHESE